MARGKKHTAEPIVNLIRQIMPQAAQDTLDKAERLWF